jgi:hypothetical protein
MHVESYVPLSLYIIFIYTYKIISYTCVCSSVWYTLRLGQVYTADVFENRWVCAYIEYIRVRIAHTHIFYY